MSRSVNMAIIIGNLAHDPALQEVSGGHKIAKFGVVTSRQWTTSGGEQKEESEFHNVVAWDKLGELCHQFLVKGRGVYVRGRLHTGSWEDEQGTKHYRTEIVARDVIFLGPPSTDSTSSPQAGSPRVRATSESKTGEEESKEEEGK